MKARALSLDLDAVAGLAPDQASLKAASGLTKKAKWPLRAQERGRSLVWGECQGSGANPYRTVFDASDRSYKCTCPSRKFPCKHVLALMWMWVEDRASFDDAVAPDWVGDWLSRRRPSAGADKTAPPPSPAGKSLAAARAADAPKTLDAAAEARKAAAVTKRAAQKEGALAAACDDLEQWIDDQLRAGLGSLIDGPIDRCRAIAARLVDGKATALAGRLDQLPATLEALPRERRLHAAMVELSKLVLLVRAFRAAPADPELRRAVAMAESRDALLDNVDAEIVEGHWEALGERVSTRRDGLVSQSTWLVGLAPAPRFALLLDFFPAAAGRRERAFAPGERFPAKIAFYPSRAPMRAVLVERGVADDAARAWPEAPSGDPLDLALAAFDRSPWLERAPVILGPGAVCRAGADRWWRAADAAAALPLTNRAEDMVFAMGMTAAIGVWDGERLDLLAAQTPWGRVGFDG